MSNPNILLIWADELRADALGCFGNTIVKTPNLDRLAKRGTVFEQCMVTQPTCTPCRASVLTGCFPSAIRSRMVGCYTPDDPRFLPRVLGDHGYRTASIGKIHLVPQRAEQALINDHKAIDGTLDYYGFQEIDLVDGHGSGNFGDSWEAAREEMAPDWRERRDARRKLDGVGSTHVYELPAEIHSSNYIAEKTREFLRNADDRPFFLHVSFPDPHHPFTVPEPYASMYKPEEVPAPLPPVTESVDATNLQLGVFHGESSGLDKSRRSDRIIGTPPAKYSEYTTANWRLSKAIYYGMITLMDDAIGRILETLDETGLSENTIVVFLSDHGEYMGDHGFLGKGFHYDSVIRTPLIFAGPEIKQQRIDQVESVIDIAPTLLEMVGADEPEGTQGISLKEVLYGSAEPPRDAVMTENDDDFVPMQVRTLTTKDWKLTYYLNHSLGELYDRKRDPEEMTNLWQSAEHSDIKNELILRLLAEVIAATDLSNGRRQSPEVPWRKAVVARKS